MRRRLVAAFAALAAGVLVAPFAWVSPASAAGGDPLAAQQYGPQQIDAPAAWPTSTGRGIVIAVVDTGVDLTHPDLAGKLVAGIDLVDGDGSPQDCPVSKDRPACGHGTHVAGIAAAATNNGVGIAGVAPEARIMPVRVLDTDGSGSVRTVDAGIRWAVDNGARVVNLSLSGDVSLLDALFGNSLEPAISYAWSKGAVVVAAAGNLQAAGASQPSGYSKGVKAIVVTATDRNRNHPSWANRADTDWSVAAPGDKIVSTVTGGGYAVMSGTSMATPHVAGVAALLLAQGLTNAQVVQRILSTAQPLGARSSDGAGLVDAAAAVGAPPAASSPAPDPATTAPPPPPSGRSVSGGSSGGSPSGSTTRAPSLELPGAAFAPFDGPSLTVPPAGDVTTIPYEPPVPAPEAVPAPELVPFGESAAPKSRRGTGPRSVQIGMAAVLLGAVLLSFKRWWRVAW